LRLDRQVGEDRVVAPDPQRFEERDGGWETLDIGGSVHWLVPVKQKGNQLCSILELHEVQPPAAASAREICR
jgi:hypothetical protein